VEGLSLDEQVGGKKYQPLLYLTQGALTSRRLPSGFRLSVVDASRSLTTICVVHLVESLLIAFDLTHVNLWRPDSPVAALNLDHFVCGIIWQLDGHPCLVSFRMLDSLTDTNHHLLPLIVSISIQHTGPNFKCYLQLYRQWANPVKTLTWIPRAYYLMAASG